MSLSHGSGRYISSCYKQLIRPLPIEKVSKQKHHIKPAHRHDDMLLHEHYQAVKLLVSTGYLNRRNLDIEGGLSAPG